MTNKPEKRGFEPINFVYGVLMGTADVIPGVSGGTVALVVGIYERLIGSIRAVSNAAVRLLRGDPADARESLRETHWGLIIPLLAGIATAILIGARILVPLLEEHPTQIRALFFGLILASVLAPWDRIRHTGARYLPTVVFGAIGAYVIVALPPAEIANPGLIVVFLAASVAICAMILPGLSGSFLLLIMGMYAPTLRALNEGDLVYVSVFLLGAAIGLGLFSKLLGYLLDHRHDVTMATLIGLMLGALRTLWPYQDEARNLLAPPDTGSLLESLGLAALGFVIVYGLIVLGRRAERAEPAGVDTV